jgi:hypothetical protein
MKVHSIELHHEVAAISIKFWDVHGTEQFITFQSESHETYSKKVSTIVMIKNPAK